jgi:hypothetical protein
LVSAVVGVGAYAALGTPVRADETGRGLAAAGVTIPEEPAKEPDKEAINRTGGTLSGRR